jgi:hypothetical protein
MPTKYKNWLSFHQRNIISESMGVWSKLEAGMICRFNYKGENVHVQRPLVLILNPRWEGKLHGISLDYISDTILRKLYDIVRETKIDRVQKLLKLRLPLLKADIRSPQRFYENSLRRFIGTNFPVGESPYRTYIRGNITNLRVIDYRFKDMYLGDSKNIDKKTTAVGGGTNV